MFKFIFVHYLQYSIFIFYIELKNHVFFKIPLTVKKSSDIFTGEQREDVRKKLKLIFI